MSKKIATIAYLKKLYGKIGSSVPKITVDDTYCPTYSDITSGKYFDYYNGENPVGLMIGSQYSVDDSTNKTYAPNQCVCEIDIMAMKPTGLRLSIIQEGTTNYGTSGTVDCMVDYEELTGETVPYDDNLRYVKAELKGLKYQKKDDGQNITSENTSVDISTSDSISYSGTATGLTDNISTKGISGKTLYAVYSNSLTSNTITINQSGETYGYYAADNTWVNAEDYNSSSYSEGYSNRITTGWLDDYGDNSGTTDNNGKIIGRDIYNTDPINYSRGIEITTDIDVSKAYTDQSMSGSPEHFGDSLPSGTTKTYHIAFADDANSGKTGDSLHWMFKVEHIGTTYTPYCSGGKSNLQASIAGYSYNNDYNFYSSRDYFKPQHCYGRTSIDRIYKKDIKGEIMVDEKGNKIPDKGFSKNPIDHLQGNYPKHWRRQIATYKQNQNWDTLTADTESMAKVTIYEKNSNSNEYKPSHRLVNGSYRVSSAVTGTYIANIYFPNNQDGNETYYAYPFFHYLSPEQCKFDDDDKKTTYHRDSAHTLTNYEGGGSGKTYAYNMSIGGSENPMIQDNSEYYLIYRKANTYDGEYCPTEQRVESITYIKEYKPEIDNNVVFREDVYNYTHGISSSEPELRNGVFDGSTPNFKKEYTIIKPYDAGLTTDSKSYNCKILAGYYTKITNENKPTTKDDWKKLLDTQSAWIYGLYFYYSTRDDGRFIENVTSAATVPYQTITFGFTSNTDNITAKITGDLSAKSTVNIEDQTVVVNIDYGTDFDKSAYIGNLVISDDSGHKLTYPIGKEENITMATARDIAANGYGAINDSDNYWCRDGTDGQGDKGKEFVKQSVNI